MALGVTDLIEAERVKYEHVWSDPRYRHNAWGLDLWRKRRSIFPAVVRTALDVGCGHGRLMAAWADEGIGALGVDIVDALDDEVRAEHGHRLTVAPLWEMPSPTRLVDVAVAADVLEHLPTVRVDASLAAIAAAARILIAQTAEYPSEDWEGRPLHLTIQPFDWWAERMRAIGGVVERLPYAGARQIHLLRWSP